MSSSGKKDDEKEAPVAASRRRKQARKLPPPVTTVNQKIRFVTAIRHLQGSYVPCPGRFLLRAKVTAVFPEDIRRWCKPVNESNGVAWHYFFSITLADATGQQEVVVAREEAKYFLRGIPASNLEENKTSLRLIKKRVAKLLKAESWGMFMVRSYPPPEEEEGDEDFEDDTPFFLFGTWISD
mmetsp:Transcript_6266/g.9766  ORF Transcript_6266/g.9766 Transcript_6266/m.9766 type:complete len:182 (+) Transcript_6266:67-612(+)